jgi:hypothetical protein
VHFVNQNVVSGKGFCHEKLFKIHLIGKQWECLKTIFRGLEQCGSGVSEKIKL